MIGSIECLSLTNSLIRRRCFQLCKNTFIFDYKWELPRLPALHEIYFRSNSYTTIDCDRSFSMCLPEVHYLTAMSEFVKEASTICMSLDLFYTSIYTVAIVFYIFSGTGPISQFDCANNEQISKQICRETGGHRGYGVFSTYI